MNSVASLVSRLETLNHELRIALEACQFGFQLCKCPVCAGWNVGPNGETERVHTDDCIVGKALAKAKVFYDR